MLELSDQGQELRARDRRIWALVKRQHGVISHRQLRDLGLGRSSIRWRVNSGRLHPVRRGVYAVGRPEMSPQGRWVAALLACGPGAVLSHSSAAALWGFGGELRGLIEVSLPPGRRSRRPGIRAHRRATLGAAEVTEHDGIPVTAPIRTLIDLATRLAPGLLERAVNEADKLERVRADILYASLDDHGGEPGVGRLRRLLDPVHFRLSDSELERAMRPVAKRAGLPVPETKAWVNEYEVDFLARARDSGRGRRTPLPPHCLTAAPRPRTRPSAYRRRPLAAAFLPLADRPRTGLRPESPASSRRPRSSLSAMVGHLSTERCAQVTDEGARRRLRACRRRTSCRRSRRASVGSLRRRGRSRRRSCRRRAGRRPRTSRRSSTSTSPGCCAAG
jgi:putative AbiEi antitoxin of type IV toxin-antitoxin system